MSLATSSLTVGLAAVIVALVPTPTSASIFTPLGGLDGLASCNAVLSTYDTLSEAPTCIIVVPVGRTPREGETTFEPGRAYGDTVGSMRELGSVSAGYRLRADYGDVGVETRATSSGVVLISDRGVSGVSSVGANTMARASFEDSATILSDSLALGDAVTLRWTGTIDHSTFTEHSPSFGNSLAATTIGVFGLALSDASTIRTIVTRQHCLGDCPDSGMEKTPTFSILVEAKVGDIVSIFGQLDAISTMFATTPASGPYSALAIASAYNSLHGYLDLETAGVRLVSASGHDYASPSVPVPEPASYALMLLGLGAIRLVSRNRKLRPHAV